MSIKPSHYFIYYLNKQHFGHLPNKHIVARPVLLQNNSSYKTFKYIKLIKFEFPYAKN